MGQSGFNIRVAVYEGLKDSFDVFSLVADRIYSGSAHEGVTYPYIVIAARDSSMQGRTKTELIQRHRVRVYAYSDSTSPAEIENISDAIFNALDRADITMLGNEHVIGITQDGINDTVLLEDGRTHRAILDFVALTQ